MTELKVTEEIRMKIYGAGACFIPKVGDSIEDFTMDQLIWAEDNLDLDLNTSIPIWLYSIEGYGCLGEYGDVVKYDNKSGLGSTGIYPEDFSFEYEVQVGPEIGITKRYKRRSYGQGDYGMYGMFGMGGKGGIGHGNKYGYGELYGQGHGYHRYY